MEVGGSDSKLWLMVGKFFLHLVTEALEDAAIKCPSVQQTRTSAFDFPTADAINAAIKCPSVRWTGTSAFDFSSPDAVNAAIERLSV